MGLVTMGPAYDAWNGKSELAPGLEHRSIRALFPMYQTPFQVVALRSSGITSVSDLNGKRVSVGPAGGTPGTYWPQFMTALGVDATVSNAGRIRCRGPAAGRADRRLRLCSGRADFGLRGTGRQPGRGDVRLQRGRTAQGP
jgi:TRAP-type uncharacterized transport system substrate-binding protein